MFTDKYLQSNLIAVGLFKSENDYNLDATYVINSGITKRKVEKIEAKKKK